MTERLKWKSFRRNERGRREKGEKEPMRKKSNEILWNILPLHPFQRFSDFVGEKKEVRVEYGFVYEIPKI